MNFSYQRWELIQMAPLKVCVHASVIYMCPLHLFLHYVTLGTISREKYATSYAPNYKSGSYFMEMFPVAVLAWCLGSVDDE